MRLTFAQHLEKPAIFAGPWVLLEIEDHPSNVSGQWDTAELAPLAGQRFFYIAAEGDARASAGQDALAELLTGQGVPITRATWDATWPREEMTAAVDRMLAQGTAVNFARFAKGAVMPEGVAAPAGSGEHMYSFDPA